MHISSIKLRGFKSFKKADIELPPDFICLAGPNGSGKTNVLDAVRFALGEKSLKSLRARKVRDLICHNSKVAEVILKFQDDKKYELRRAIREDGKIRYMLNGKITTRTAILELLKRYNLDSSGRNIIAQGEVQRIVEISGRERRMIIDAVAGIAEFEAKKKEALRELDIVERRMSDANLVMGERIAFLKELEVERGRALEYSSSVELVKRAKATLLKMELESAKKKKTKMINAIKDAKMGTDSVIKKLDGIARQIEQEEAEKAKVSAEISAREERERLFREMEKTRAEITSQKQVLEESKEHLEKHSKSLQSIESDMKKEKEILETLRSEEQELRKKMVPLESLKLQHNESPEIAAVRQSLEKLEAGRTRIREQMIALKGEIETAQSLIAEKQKALEGGEGEGPEGGSLEGEIKGMRSQLTEIVASQDRLFAKEKELNSENASLDRTLLSLREKVATLRAQTSVHIRNPALQFIAELKKSGKIKGIHGTVAELIEFKPEYSKAIDAAGGARLLYVVVDSSDVAIKIISQLKSSGRGRATFLPLKEIACPKITAKGGMGLLSEFVRFNPQYSNAIDFVFGNTLLVENSKDAKSIGIGHERMVTADGDLFEKSGTITGGKTRGGVATAVQLSKMEAELEAVKSRKTGLIDDLTGIRQDMSALRREKAEVDVALRKKEVELDSITEKIEERKKREKKSEETKSEIEKLKKFTELSASKLDSYGKKLQEQELEVQRAQEELHAKMSSESSRFETMEREREEKTEMYSSLRAKADSKRREAEVRSDGLKDKEQRHVRFEREHAELSSHITQSIALIARKEADLLDVERKVGASDLAVQKLIGLMKEFEKRLQEFGEKRGALNMELSKHEKTLTVAEVELQNIETRIADLQAECEEYGEVEILEGKREALLEQMKSAEALISGLGAVNLAAPEMYEEKQKEVSEMQEKIERLRIEKEAVIDMIAGIEEKKKEAFFATFHEVDKQFRKLFTLINIGEGHLYLDKPSTPFESGLYIKVKRNEREHSLESLSGGEKSLVALMFVFALQFYKPSPFYVLDEVDAPLDKVNTKNLAKLLKELAPQSQFLVVSHNDIMLGLASAVLGVSRVDGISRIVGVKLEKGKEVADSPIPPGT